MSENETQQTPTGHKIPVPTREGVLADLAKVAKSAKRPAPAAGEPGPEEGS